MKFRKLVAAIACRSQGSRLYGKPLQNLDTAKGIRIIDNIINCLQGIQCLDEIVLGISEGLENEAYKDVADRYGLPYVVGDEIDVLSRLIECGSLVGATDIFRVTSESPFPSYSNIESAWSQHKINNSDATFLDDVIDGCGFEIITLDALKISHANGESKHRSELCSLYLRENAEEFAIDKISPPDNLVRKDLRLTVDNPEDLVVCRKIYAEFLAKAPYIDISEIVTFLDGNQDLKRLLSPFVEAGYSSMYL